MDGVRGVLGWCTLLLHFIIVMQVSRAEGDTYGYPRDAGKDLDITTIYEDYDEGMADDLMAPTNVTVIPTSPNELEVTWDVPRNCNEARLYEVTWSGPGMPDNAVTQNTTYRIQGLEACEIYRVTVAADCKGTYHESSEQWAQTLVEVPPPPQSCLITSTQANLASVKWESPSSSCAMVNYRVDWAWQALWQQDLQDEGQVEVKPKYYTIRDIAAYSNVSVAVAARTAAGYGPSTTCTGQTQQSAPSAPKKLSLEEKEGIVQASWVTPDEANGIITAYRVSWGTNSQEFPGDDTFGQLTEIDACMPHNFTVAAKTVEFGPDSEATEFTASGQMPIDNMTCTAQSHSINVAWSSTQCDPHRPNTNYSVTWESYVLWSQQTDSGADQLDGAESSWSLQDATPYTQYHVCVALSGSAGDWGGACCNVTTPEEAPSAPSITSAASVYDSALVQWLPPELANGVVQGYIVEWTGAFGNGSEDVGAVEGFNITGLEVCGEYEVKVTARTIVPGEKSTPKIFNITNYMSSVECAGVSGGVNMSVRLASGKCSVPLIVASSRVQVLWSGETGTLNKSISEPPPVLNEVLKLPPYTQANTKITQPDADYIYCQCEATTPEDVPDKPQNLTLVSVNETSASLEWKKPHQVNGVIQDYALEWKLGTDVVDTGTTKDMNFIIKRLKPNSIYQTFVRGRTGAGSGPAASITITTKGDQQPPSSGPPLGVVVGGAVGGVVVLAAATGGVVWLRKSGRNNNAGKQGIDNKVEMEEVEDEDKMSVDL